MNRNKILYTYSPINQTNSQIKDFQIIWLACTYILNSFVHDVCRNMKFINFHNYFTTTSLLNQYL